MVRLVVLVALTLDFGIRHNSLPFTLCDVMTTTESEICTVIQNNCMGLSHD